MTDEAWSGTPWLDDPILKAALDRRPPDVREVRSRAIELWRRSTSTPGNHEFTADDEVRAGEWLRELRSKPGLEALAFGLGGQRALSYSYGFFADLSQKISWLKQRSCSTCQLASSDLPWFDMPLRLRPMSRQSITGADVNDLRRRIRAAHGDHFYQLFEIDVCVALTFVLGAGRSKVLDIDNMAKTTCDALRGTVYRDDNQIQHLDLLKVRMVEEAEEWVHVRVRPTAVASHLDVFDPTIHHKFAVDKL